jgi:hypothetical protein
MIDAQTFQEWAGGIKENDRRVNSSMTNLIIIIKSKKKSKDKKI